jgi:hypothetical protein
MEAVLSIDQILKALMENMCLQHLLQDRQGLSTVRAFLFMMILMQSLASSANLAGIN